MDYNHYSARRGQMRAMDGYAVGELGIRETTLMYNAAGAVFDVLSEEGLIGAGCTAVVLCGSGGNGGDGWALCDMLRNSGASVFAVKCFDSVITSKAADHYYSLIKDNIKVFSIEQVLSDPSVINGCTLILDCVYGTGFRGELNERLRGLFGLANSSHAARVSVDIPSGADCDSGQLADGSFCADITVTFVVPKTGLCSYPSARNAGEVIVRDIGMPERAVYSAGLKDLYPNHKYIARLLPARHPDSNKGDFGRVLGICGSSEMTGAAVLAARGALNSGVGLYACACPQEILRTLQSHLVEPIFVPLPDGEGRMEILIKEVGKASCVLCGCGSGTGAEEVVRRVLPEVKCPVVLDADALNALSRCPELFGGIKAPLIITPHPGEMSRLCGRSISEIQSDRINTARSFSEKHGCVTLLKGARTVIAAHDGRLCINPTGNAGMARGGSGDVLAGVIASFAAQGMDTFDAAVCGAYVHGLAGDICRDEVGIHGMSASGITNAVAKAMHKITGL